MPTPTPSVMILWDAHGATLHRWTELDVDSGAYSRGAGGGVASHRLDAIGHLPLATLARAAMYNVTYARWQVAHAEAMREA